MKSNRPAIILSAAFIFASAAYALAARPDDEDVHVGGPVATTTVPQTAAPQTRFKDGAYTGPAVDAYYGLVQVKATITNGALADVAFLQYPNDRQTSREISAQAIPMLIQEAIQAQSASVDIISGATQTSEGFVQSLGAALAQARS